MSSSSLSFQIHLHLKGFMSCSRCTMVHALSETKDSNSSSMAALHWSASGPWRVSSISFNLMQVIRHRKACIREPRQPLLTTSFGFVPDLESYTSRCCWKYARISLSVKYWASSVPNEQNKHSFISVRHFVFQPGLWELFIFCLPVYKRLISKGKGKVFCILLSRPLHGGYFKNRSFAQSQK